MHVNACIRASIEAFLYFSTDGNICAMKLQSEIPTQVCPQLTRNWVFIVLIWQIIVIDVFLYVYTIFSPINTIKNKKSVILSFTVASVSKMQNVRKSRLFCAKITQLKRFKEKNLLFQPLNQSHLKKSLLL